PSCIRRRPPHPPLFPYTTLFRSDQARAARENLARLRAGSRPEEIQAGRARVAAAAAQIATYEKAIADATVVAPVSGIVTEKLARSEEHTSELQSRSDLVCRLLLE